MSEHLSFEESLAKLESVVEKLESGECTLDQALELYTEGAKLSQKCNKYLSDAKLKIATLSDAEEELDAGL